MADPNTRQGKRTPVTLKIKFKSETLEQFIERYAVDVSQGGIFIRTKEPLAVGTQMRFEFQLRDASPLIGGEGTVVWTRENDPSRPAIAPGMGVRFDRLAEGSQSVLERILAEKAKQAPVRGANESSKPPLFTDTPTRVAPPPVQEALLGNEKPTVVRQLADDRRRHPDSFNDQHTPLPKPMPFHSDADEFPEEAFEEATKVRALDELVAQTALDSGAGLQAPSDELAARRLVAGGGRHDATLADPPEETIPPGGTAVGVPKAPFDRDSAPGLPSPPLPGAAANNTHTEPPKPRLLDTTPSPRNEGAADPMEQFAKTKLGMEPVAVQTRQATGPVATTGLAQQVAPIVPKDAPTKPTGMRAVAAEPTQPVRAPAAPRKSKAPLIILLLVILAGGGAALWFFVIRDMVEESNGKTASNGSAKKDGSNKVGADGSAKDGSAKDGSAKEPAGSGSETKQAGSGSDTKVDPKVELVELEITASVDKANVEIVGTDQKGPAPFKAKLEKDKTYKVRVFASHFLATELEVKGGQADKPVAKLTAKPRVIDITSNPTGALIFIDDAPTGSLTPFKYKLDPTKAAKKTLRLRLYKNGYKQLEKVIAAEGYVEDDTAEVFKVDEKLTLAPVVIRPNPPTGSGSSGSAGSGVVEPGSGSTTPTPGSGETPPAGSGTTPPAGSGTTPPPPTPGSSSGGAEPEPGFMKGGTPPP